MVLFALPRLSVGHSNLNQIIYIYIYLIQTFLVRSKFFRYIYGTGNYRNENIVKNELTVQHDTIICDPYLGRVYFKIKYGKV